MSLDSLNAQALLLELTPLLTDCRVQKFSQIDDNNFAVHLRSPGRTDVLLLCLHPDQSRFQLLEERPGPAVVPSAFVMLGRKLFGGTRLEELTLNGSKRALIFEFSSNVRLVFDWHGKPSALLLLDAEATVLQAYPSRGRFRIRDAYPIASKAIQLISGSELLDRLEKLPNPQPLNQAISLAYDVIPPLWAKRLAQEKNLASAWDELIAPLKANDPSLLRGGWEPDGELSFRSLSPQATTLNSVINQRWCSKQVGPPGLPEHRHDLLRHLNKGLTKAKRKLERRQLDRQGAQTAPSDKLYGDLILTFAAKQGRRETVLHANDWEGHPVTIQLDPALTGPENAHRYYTRAKKKQRALTVLAEQISLAYEELAFWDELILAAELAESRTDLEEIRRSLPRVHQGPIKRAPLAPSSGPRRFTHQGFQILVGRNPSQNEQLAFKQASKDDPWFHIRQGAGSHVILRRAGRQPERSTIEAAAWLAATYSRSSQNPHCEVAMTYARNLKKPKGSPLGKVTYRGEETLVVNPTTPKPEGLIRLDKKEDSP